MVGVARSIILILAVCAGLVTSGVVVSAQEIGTYAYVDAQALNLRAAPNTRSSISQTLPRGTLVNILERRGNWMRVFVQRTDGETVDGWLSARYLSWNADPLVGSGSFGYNSPTPEPESSDSYYGWSGPLRVSKLDFDCRPPLFGNSGIRDCVASVRVQLSGQDYDPDLTDVVLIACHGMITYRTENDQRTRRMFAVERGQIARNDRLGQSMRVDFDVRSQNDKIVSAQLQDFSCARD